MSRLESRRESSVILIRCDADPFGLEVLVFRIEIHPKLAKPQHVYGNQLRP